MTILNNKGTRLIKFECDGCGEILDPNTANFTEATHEVDEAGWSYRKIGEKWVHKCLDCRSAK